MARTKLIMLFSVVMAIIGLNNAAPYYNPVVRSDDIHFVNNHKPLQVTSANKSSHNETTTCADKPGFETENTKTPPIIVGCVWALISLIMFITWIVSTMMTPIVETVFDGCYAGSGIYSYLVKLRTGVIPRDFFDVRKKMASLSLDLNDRNNNFISRLRVPISAKGADKENSRSEDERRSIKFKVVTATQFPKLGSVRIDHSSFKDTIQMYYIEIRDLAVDKFIFKALVNTRIRSLGPINSDFAQQVFKFKGKAHMDEDTDMGKGNDEDKLEFDTEVPANLSALEYVLLFFFAINVIFVSCLLVPVSACFLTSYSMAAINGAISALIALLATALFICIYKGIKRQQSNENSFSIARIVAIVIIFASALCFGGSAAYHATRLACNHEMYWGMAIGLATFIFLTVGITSMLIDSFCLFTKRTSTVGRSMSENKDVESGIVLKMDSMPIPSKKGLTANSKATAPLKQTTVAAMTDNSKQSLIIIDKK